MTRVVLTVIGLLAGLRLTVALVTGLGLAMSSTAFVLQLLTEKHKLGMSHGRASSAILLLQEIAVIPLLALDHVYRVMNVGALVHRKRALITRRCIARTVARNLRFFTTPRTTAQSPLSEKTQWLAEYAHSRL